MIGNKFAAEELIRNFQKRLSKIQSLKKAASQETSSPEGNSHDVKPEDFLVELSVDSGSHKHDLDSTIEEVSSYAEDDIREEAEVMTSCVKCGESYADDPEHSCKTEEVVVLLDSSSDPRELLEDLMDAKAKNVLFELGKIASELRNDKNGFAADMVEATALDIINDLVKEAKKKAVVLDTLSKMASDSYSKGDNLTGDVILATANKIKNG